MRASRRSVTYVQLLTDLKTPFFSDPAPLRLNRPEMTREALLAALDELKDPEFDRFKWHLTDERSHKHLSIAKTKLEHAERCDTVDLMIGVFTTELMVVTATRDILAKLQRNDLSRKLKKRG